MTGPTPPIHPQQPDEAPRPNTGASLRSAPGILPSANPLIAVLAEADARRVIARVAIAAGTPILRIEGRLTDLPTRHSVQVGASQHIDPFDLFDDAAQVEWRSWMYLNHHCEPNAELRERVLVALRDIAEGEDVTFDYNTTEWELAEPFSCACGSPRCVGVVRGARFRRR
ncbi:MAG: SET domain-containing protein-lysine N-methyltransferase [Gemmatimonadaceae bacterium]|nr:SET domain-containing protein-lysine N-methyltransferase [Gemmatimonadaceae bacterium]